MSDESASKVTITVTGCSVTIEADEPLDKVQEATLALFRDVCPPGVDRPGPAGIGFHTQIDPQYDHDRQQGSQWRPVRAEGDLR